VVLSASSSRLLHLVFIDDRLLGQDGVACLMDVGFTSESVGMLVLRLERRAAGSLLLNWRS